MNEIFTFIPYILNFFEKIFISVFHGKPEPLEKRIEQDSGQAAASVTAAINPALYEAS